MHQLKILVSAGKPPLYRTQASRRPHRDLCRMSAATVRRLQYHGGDQLDLLKRKRTEILTRMTKIAQLTKRQSVDREPTTASNLHPTDPNGVGLGAKMNIHQHTAKNPTLHERLFIMLLLATIPAVFGCGVLPAGQGSTRNLTVTGFTSPVAMAYSTATSVQAIVPGIAISETGATGFVQRLIMQAVSCKSLMECFLS
ncbi:hypothetical protein KIN20_018274 [Parelaphostrongylus tenuis]|uniref:Uncharacterized protein n=1 Tax=Parelaphostrongylus tenuis TaxID=148309 RepID=A0AAD5QU86_PARTN|nr:hypothetical protein KIN20_018274 [Parelaphostrongylus tenuis]